MTRENKFLLQGTFWKGLSGLWKGFLCTIATTKISGMGTLTLYSWFRQKNYQMKMIKYEQLLCSTKFQQKKTIIKVIDLSNN